MRARVFLLSVGLWACQPKVEPAPTAEGPTPQGRDVSGKAASSNDGPTGNVLKNRAAANKYCSKSKLDLSTKTIGGRAMDCVTATLNLADGNYTIYMGIAAAADAEERPLSSDWSIPAEVYMTYYGSKAPAPGTVMDSADTDDLKCVSGTGSNLSIDTCRVTYKQLPTKPGDEARIEFELTFVGSTPEKLTGTIANRALEF